MLVVLCWSEAVTNLATKEFGILTTLKWGCHVLQVELRAIVVLQLLPHDFQP